MSVNVKGEKELLSSLEEKFGKKRIQQISDEALLKGAEIFKQALISSIGTSGKYAKGYTAADTTIGEPFTQGGVRVVPIHWNGPHDRYRIIHLNEFGTVKNPNPPRKGAIARAMRNAETAYRNAIKQAILEGIG